MKQQFTLVLHSGPMSLGVQSALRFAQSIIKLNHQLEQVFFYGDGVYCCSNLLTPMQDEFNSVLIWQQFSQAYHIPMHVCIASALRRGLIDEKESTNNNHDNHNISVPFILTGLGQLAKAFYNQHRVIQFGR
ncbi:MAG: sulfurtransferase complex subunit TusD [Legionellales bacterium]|nr:sulfurtransferase complex subunit TusD [Legionellales bacterium]|tara:strand:+ start:163 stop:558 length:396 start_codon:yes stop_codon:yes gene_type:complete